jgi:hypothetical protein
LCGILDMVLWEWHIMVKTQLCVMRESSLRYRTG